MVRSTAQHVYRAAGWQWSADELAASPGFEAVHAGSLALALEPGNGRQRPMDRAQRFSGTESIDLTR